MILGQTKVNLIGIDGLTHKQNHVLNLLYAPLLHPLSLKLYHLLLCLNDLCLACDYDLMIDFLGCTLDELEAARKNNEKLGLIKTSHKDNQHQIELIAPKSASEFFHHDLLGRLYIQECGVSQLKIVTSLIKENEKIKDTVDMSQQISMSEFSSYNHESEALYKQELAQFKPSRFDIELFLSSANEVMFPKSVRTQENIEAIIELADQYQLTLDQVRLYVAQSMNKKNDKLNLKQLKEYASNQLIKIESKDPNPLNWTTPEFLQSKMGDVPVLETTLKSIDFIRNKYHFNDQVLNVLIDYALNNNKGILARRYLDTIASAMHLNKVVTLQDAINHFAFNQKPSSRQTQTVIKYVDYSNQAIEGEQNKEDLEEILKELKSWK